MRGMNYGANERYAETIQSGGGGSWVDTNNSSFVITIDGVR